MVANKNNMGSYAELFDVDRFREIAQDVRNGKGTNGKYSDIECFLHSIMKHLVEDGKEE